ncbi:MAG TPA: hypothetical protein DCE56_05530, partial [Cyanobacteria bacterium UBA8553]|nr:hypothetical protein [Cyanobacteria bacterium UBA8553]
LGQVLTNLPIESVTSSSTAPSETQSQFPGWFVYPAVVFFLLGLNLVVTPRLPSNIQRPLGVVSFFCTTFAIAPRLRLDLQTLMSSSTYDPPIEEWAATPEQLYVTTLSPSQDKSSYEQEPSPKQRLLEYLKQLKANLEGQVLQPAGVSDAPMGRSEDAFASVLERYFPCRVKRQLEFPIPQSELGRSFSTDFAVVLDELGLHIDVEIDEPFELKKKRPTHCIDDYRDRYRNGFFLQGNWIVIRFAEEQVVRYPKSCCREIAAAIALVTGIDKFLKPLAGEPILQPIPQWTKKQARALAKTNYRDTYLSLLCEKNST